jgi:phosphinothricin acetyltransferase
VGYAYASPYRLRPAYRHTAENSVYLHPAWAGRGIGRQSMSALLAEREAGGLQQIMAITGDSEVGVLHSVGFKFGRWIDSMLMQRDLGAGDSTPP